MATEKTEVVIIGVGAAGGILATELSKAGMKVTGLERGPRLVTPDFKMDELRYYQRGDMMPNARRQPVTWRPNAKVSAKPHTTMGCGDQAGGATIHYGAVSWRFHEDDFRPRSQTIERYGKAAVPEDSSLLDWPLTYADLEPFYDQAEYDLGVSGKAGNLQGRKIDGGNIFEAPRRREYPLPPLLGDQSTNIFDEAARKLGYHPFPTPKAILSEPYKGRPNCSYCGFCQGYGCHLGAKSSILVTKLPEADRTGNFKLITGAMVYRVNSDNSGRATGVSYWGPGSSENTIEAEIVIVTTQMFEGTRLLLLSKTDKFLNGLANSSGQLGKHYISQTDTVVFAAFDDKITNTFMGPGAQKHSLDDFNANNFDHSELGFIRGAQISVQPTSHAVAGPLATAVSINPPPGIPLWGAAYRDFLAKYYTRHVGIVAQTEGLPYPDNMIDLDPNVRDKWGLPAPRLTFEWQRPNELTRHKFMRQKLNELAHAMDATHVWDVPPGGGHIAGGTRMGSDPTSSIVNRYGQSWDVPNLFIVGCGNYPSYGSFNPTLTLQALAYMSADAIVKRYKNKPAPLV